MADRVIRHRVLGIALCLTIMCSIGVLSFSIPTLFDKIVFLLMFLVFGYCILLDIKDDKTAVCNRLKEQFATAKMLYLVFALYFIWDVITILYTKDMYLALKKFPTFLVYFMILLAGIYYCNSIQRIIYVMATVALTGTIVSIGSYFYYFLSFKPIYFQRLSTARDYNVYSTIIIFGIIFATVYLMNFCRLSFAKRIMIYTVVCLVNLPTLYFAGSRRMVIMIPYFFLFAILYEAIRLLVSKKAPRRVLFHNLSFLCVIAVIFFLTASTLPLFSRYGSQKEDAYKKWLFDQKDNDTEVSNEETRKEEKTINEILDTITDKSMFGKRTLIYSVAFNEIKQFRFTDWIFGRGAAYDLYMYDTTTDKALLEAYSIDENNPRTKGWMSAHNFALADLLNGGLIKLTLGLTLVGTIIATIIRTIAKRKRVGILLVIPFALVFVNNFISGAYGMLNDIFFNVMLIMLCGINFVNQKEIANERKQISMYYDECASL